MKTIDVFTPAHNESATIQQSLQSIRSSFSIQDVAQNIQYKIFVGCNGCTDDTAEKARHFADIVFEWPAFGKWKTLRKFTENSKADFIFFIDAGAKWPKDLLNQNFLDCLERNDFLGLTFSYFPKKMNWIEKTYWSIENFFKNIEMKSGGLVAVSGITMLFERKALAEAFIFLDENFPNSVWLNDDVVLPVTLRFMNPQKKIYLVESSKIDDLGLAKPASEKNRRLRMMRGNLQWIRGLTPYFFKKEYRSKARFQILLLLSRRIVKIFWSYVPLFALLVLAFFLNNIIYAVIFTLISAMMIALILASSKFRASFLASLRAPLDLLFWDEKSNSLFWS